MEETLFDTILVGAGPVGSYLAEKLTRLGHKIAVLEKKAGAGHDICCTGIVGRQCLRQLSVPPELILRSANAATFFSPSGTSIRLERQEPVAYVVDRAGLEQVLAARAIGNGARYFFSSRVTRIEVLPDKVCVSTLQGGARVDHHARTVVIAAGFGPDLPRRLGLGAVNEALIGAQARVALAEDQGVEVYFDERIAPGGFGWLVPTAKGEALAGILTRQPPQPFLRYLLERLEARGTILSAEVPFGLGKIPLQTLPKTCGDRVLVVGEAAGQVKPTTGGGIYYGILCADIAAETLDHSLRTDRCSLEVLSRYEQAWRAKLGGELRIGCWAQGLRKRLGNDAIAYLFEVAGHSRMQALIRSSETFSFDWHGRLLLQLVCSILPSPDHLERTAWRHVSSGPGAP